MQSKKEQALDILMLEPGATQKQVKSAYRREALRTHPDKGGEQKDFELVKQAYEYLVKHGTGIPTPARRYEPEVIFPSIKWHVWGVSNSATIRGYGFSIMNNTA